MVFEDKESASDNRKKIYANCPIGRLEFLHSAPHLEITISEPLAENRQPPYRAVAVPREMATGSFGWTVCRKLLITINGIDVNCQLAMNITVIGSKLLPK